MDGNEGRDKADGGESRCRQSELHNLTDTDHVLQANEKIGLRFLSVCWVPCAAIRSQAAMDLKGVQASEANIPAGAPESLVRSQPWV